MAAPDPLVLTGQVAASPRPERGRPIRARNPRHHDVMRGVPCTEPEMVVGACPERSRNGCLDQDARDLRQAMPRFRSIKACRSDAPRGINPTAGKSLRSNRPGRTPSPVFQRVSTGRPRRPSPRHHLSRNTSEGELAAGQEGGRAPLSARRAPARRNPRHDYQGRDGAIRRADAPGARAWAPCPRPRRPRPRRIRPACRRSLPASGAGRGGGC